MSTPNPKTSTDKQPIRYLGDQLTRGQKLVYILVLGLLTALGPFTVDLYLPAFPAIQQQFGVDASAVQLTLTGTMVGFSLGQLIVGPLSDKIGRKGPLVGAAILHIGASIAAALSPSIAWLSLFRLLQGFGAASSGVVSMAMVRDLFGGRPLVKMLSRLALVNGLAPVIAPVVGSQLLMIMNWHGIFWVLAAYGAFVTVAVAIFIEETLPPHRRKRNELTLVGRYVSLSKDRIYIGSVLLAGMNFTGLFAYLSSSPFLFQDLYGFSAQQYGALFAVNSLAVIIGVQTASRLMHTGTVQAQWILSGTTAAQLVLGTVIFLNGWFSVGPWGTIIPLWFFILACGFSFPAVQYLALSRHGNQAGTAASLLGAINFGLAGILSPVIGLFGMATPMPMAGMMMSAAAVALVLLWAVIRPRTVVEVED